MPTQSVRTSKRFAGVISAVALVFALGSADAARAAKIKLVFPTPASTSQLPLYVAQKKGWLGDLEVEELYVAGDANAMRSLLSGSADIGVVGSISVLASVEAKANIRAINSWQPVADYNLVVAKGKGDKLADLAGKIFAGSGPGNLPDQLPRIILKKHGIDDSTLRFVSVGGHPARLQAVIGGRADATMVNALASQRGLDDGKVTLLAKLSDELPGTGLNWTVVRTESLGNPDLAAAFQTLTDAGIRGSRYIQEHPDEAADILHARLPDLELPLLRAVMRDFVADKLYGMDGGLDPAIEEFTANLAYSLGNLKTLIAAKDLLDPRFVDVSLKKLGRYSSK